MSVMLLVYRKNHFITINFCFIEVILQQKNGINSEEFVLWDMIVFHAMKKELRWMEFLIKLTVQCIIFMINATKHQITLRNKILSI